MQYFDSDFEDKTENINVEEFNHDQITTDEIEGYHEVIDGMAESSVQLEGLDSTRPATRYDERLWEESLRTSK